MPKSYFYKKLPNKQQLKLNHTDLNLWLGPGISYRIMLLIISKIIL